MQEPRQLVVRLLNTSDIERVVPRLPAEVLHRLIDTCGLEACAEVVALATPRQLQRLLDLDLWRAPVPGADERLDVVRFGEWVEILLELGPAIAADRLAAMDFDLVVGGVAAHVRVFDAGAVSAYTSLDGERMEHYVRRGRVREIAGFVVEARESPAWEAIVDLLAGLQAERPALFQAVMRGCVKLSDGERERDSIDDLPVGRDQQLADLAASRQTRRDRQGFVSPADARAFLQAARSIRLGGGRPAVNAIAHAYSRDVASEPIAGDEEDGASDAPLPAVRTVMDILADGGLIAAPLALLGGGAADSTALALVRAFTGTHPASHEEVAFLTNTVLAGGAIHERALAPPQAADLVAATCNLGLENWPAAWPAQELTTAFQIGWTLLHQDLCCHAARTLADVLGVVHCADGEIEWSLQMLRQDLRRHLARGEPWRARAGLDALLPLDAAAWAVLRSFIAECPTMHPAMQRGARTIDPEACTFVSCNAEIAAARTYLASLDARLSG